MAIRPVNVNRRLDDRQWLVRQYILRERTIDEIAQSAGANPSSVWRALRRHGIPLRGPAGKSRIDDRTARQALQTSATIRDAEREMDLSRTTLNERARLWGMTAGGPLGPDDLPQRYLAGASVVQLAAEHGVTPRTIGRWLRSRDVPLRPRGRPPKS